METQIKQEKEEVDLTRQVIIPTHRDLVDSKKYKIPLLRYSPYAVFVKKIDSKNKNRLMSHNQIKSNQDIFSDFVKDFKYDFLVDFQLANGTLLTNDDMQFIEKAQQIPGLKYMCLLEQFPNQTSQELDKQIKDWKKRNPSKELIVVSEVYTRDMADKIAVAKRNGLKKYAIKFRNYRRYKSLFSKFLATIRALEMHSIVHGVNPTRWKATNASMLLPPAYFKANAIASWIAWRGRATPLTLLCEDWIFKEVSKASQGMARYSGKNRLQIVSNNKQFNTGFKRIDTINQASMMLQKLKPLTKVQFERLLK